MIQWGDRQINKQLQYRVTSAATVGSKGCLGTAGEMQERHSEPFPGGGTGGWEGHSGRGSSSCISLEDAWFVPGSEEEEHESVI